ncbi:unnamed protein product [Microthlaspi erraticum]|uniref:Uncharacterized protein n=1 Tax=Microthlaspi erraticum TaxID=1685480 RepID=A0A6D2JXC4_9BRAS|nr:unnamed protein product [Microthlaspi erraticum]
MGPFLSKIHPPNICHPRKLYTPGPFNSDPMHHVVPKPVPRPKPPLPGAGEIVPSGNTSCLNFRCEIRAGFATWAQSGQYHTSGELDWAYETQQMVSKPRCRKDGLRDKWVWAALHVPL